MHEILLFVCGEDKCRPFLSVRTDDQVFVVEPITERTTSVTGSTLKNNLMGHKKVSRPTFAFGREHAQTYAWNGRAQAAQQQQQLHSCSSSNGYKLKMSSDEVESVKLCSQCGDWHSYHKPSHSSGQKKSAFIPSTKDKTVTVVFGTTSKS